MDKDIINILKKSFISQQSLTSEEQRIFDEWMKEAAARGLKNVRTTPEAARNSMNGNASNRRSMLSGQVER